MWFLRRSCAISRAGVFAVAEITRLVITSRAFMTATYNVELVKTGAERRTKEGGNRKLGLRCSIDVRRRRVRVLSHLFVAFQRSSGHPRVGHH